MSDWDWLPLEIQDYIIKFAESQPSVEQQRKEIVNKINKEMSLYSKVQEAWGLGGL